MQNRNRKQVPKRKIQSQINITPLIDVLLVLIVIFMVMTPINSTGLHASIPTSAPVTIPAPEPQKDSLVLSVEIDGTITLNHSKVNSSAELGANLQDIFKTRNDRTIFVQGAKNLDFDVVAHVIDTAVGSGASRIGLLTDEIH